MNPKDEFILLQNMKQYNPFDNKIGSCHLITCDNIPTGKLMWSKYCRRTCKAEGDNIDLLKSKAKQYFDKLSKQHNQIICTTKRCPVRRQLNRIVMLLKEFDFVETWNHD